MATSASKRFTDLLISSGLVTEQQLKEARDIHRQQGGSLTAILMQQGVLEERYQGWSQELGRGILTGKTSLDELAAHSEKTGLDPAPRSGGQERIENLVARQLK